MDEYLISADRIEKLEKALGYKFSNINLLIQSLTHPSLRQHVLKNTPYIKDNERLELLGDSIIGFIITEIIFKNFTDYNEGKLATVKSHLVCKDLLCKIASKINLADYIIMTHGEEASGGRSNPNNIENAMEALIAAIYLDSNIETTKLVINNLWAEFLQSSDLTKTDPKSALQELVQSMGPSKPIYEIKTKEGLPHAPNFTVEARVNDYKQLGHGHSVKAAEKEAASKLLKILQSETK